MMTLSRYAGCLLVGLTVLTAVTTSCAGSKSSDNNEAAADTLATTSNGVEIEYSSAEALNAPAYDPDAELGSPLALQDGLTQSWTAFPIVDVGAYPEGGKMVYDILIFNQSPDTVAVRSIKLPDNTMECFMEGLRVYKPGLLNKLQLKSDSAITMDDYRFILTYEGDKYPPQTFHINLRPDIHKLIAERDAQKAAE